MIYSVCTIGGVGKKNPDDFPATALTAPGTVPPTMVDIPRARLLFTAVLDNDLFL